MSMAKRDWRTDPRAGDVVRDRFTREALSVGDDGVTYEFFGRVISMSIEEWTGVICAPPARLVRSADGAEVGQ